MPILNFKEIPEAHIAHGQQDTFELFARDFFTLLGLEVIDGPDRGQDGGRDLVVVEKRLGVVSNEEFKWLVSCKHKAHSGNAVLERDEFNILDRVQSHNCDGFIGFYSTVISSPFHRRLNGLKENIPVKIFDNELIENELFKSQIGLKTARRYFPLSYRSWFDSHQGPSNVLDEYEPLSCSFCGNV